jgi:hypothetical protein
MHVIVLFAMDNIDYVGYDYETCLPSRLVVGRSRCSYME